MMPIEGRISGSLIFQNCDKPVMPSHLGGLDHLVGNGEQRGVDQHHRNADELPDGDQRRRAMSAVLSWPSQGANRALQADEARSGTATTPQIGDRMSFQMKPTITKESSVGMKMAVR